MGFGLTRREAALVLVTLLWGGTFYAVQVALTWASPFALVGVRFAIAAALLGAVLAWQGAWRGLNRFELRAGLVLGFWVYLGFGLQTAGLQHIESSKSGFLTALYVPFVPLVLLLWKRQMPSPWAWAAIGMAMLGTYALTGASLDVSTWNIGDWLTVACALAFALEIVFLGHYSRHCDPVRLACVLVGVASGLSWATAGWLGESGVQWSLPFVGLIVALACITAFVQFAMSWAQQAVPETRATLIYSMEPVWAAVVGALAGERLGWLGLVGGACIVAAVWIGKLRA
jgi:drug/metabolite transporter (DMT)-like permease